MLAATGKPRLNREQRRALKILAGAPRGLNEEVLILAYGFSSDTITRLVQAGLATPVTQTRKVPRGLMITVERIRITDDGRKALED
jgi:hypothetical protein